MHANHKDEPMTRGSHKPAGFVALGVAFICLIALPISLTDHLDRRVTHGTELTEPPLPVDGQQQERIREVVPRALIRPPLQLAGFPAEPTRNQKIEEYYELKDALDLRDEIRNELYRESKPQFHLNSVPATD